MKNSSHKREQLAEQLRHDIYERELSSGSQIGSVRQLAMRYHVTPLTISRLLAEMVESGELFRDEKGACHVNFEVPCKPHLGYAGTPLLPGGGLNCLLASALGMLFGELEKTNALPLLIGYHELRNPEIARKRLASVNGLLLLQSFVDEHTVDLLNSLKIPIVLFGQTFPQERLSNCSEVVQYMDPALAEFAEYCDLTSYRRIINLHEVHSNALVLSQKITDFLEARGLADRIEDVAVKTPDRGSAEIEVFCYFMNLPERDWRDVLVISGSGFFSRGLYRAQRQKGRKMPDILSVDNLDDYEKCPLFPEPYLTAIDRNMDRIFRDAAQLCCEQVRNRDERKVVIKVPSKLVIRKSITHINPNWKGE